MSDTDDGFDREAEKERLREKYEKEQADREATQQMSELLLQGATMTNRHCDNCGNPVFRHQGREFCPVCGAEVVEGDGQVDEAAAGDAAQQDAGGQAQSAAAGGQVEEGQQPGTDRQPGSGQQSSAEQYDATGQQVPTGRPARGGTADATQPTSTAPQAGAAGDLGEARAALVRTVTGLAQQAEESRDVGRTRELLAAAREAAEALAALDRTGR